MLKLYFGGDTMGFSFNGTKDIQGYFGLQSSSFDGRRAKYKNDNDYPVRIKSITFTAEAGASGYTFYWYGSSVTGGGKIYGFKIQVTNSDGTKVYATSNGCDIGGSITTYSQYDESNKTTWKRFNYSDVDQEPTFTFSSPPVIPAGTTVYIDLCSLRDSNVMSGKVLCFNKPNGTISGDVVPNSYNVTLDVNSGNSLSGWSPKSVTVGESVTLPSATRSGHNFLNWNTEQDGSGTKYNAGVKYTPTKDITLYARWELKTYTITYDLNGGTNGPSNGTKTHDKDYTIPSTEPKKTGYTFSHWLVEGTTYTKQPGDKITSNQSFTLKAIWKINTYTIAYDANGGSGAPSNQTKTYGVSLKLSSTKPTRTGYTFKGWATSKTATTANYQPGASYTDNATVTLYAVWQKNTYTNTIVHWKYVGTGGDNSNGTYKKMGSSTFTAEYNDSVIVPSSLVQSYIGHYNTGFAGSYWGGDTWHSKEIGKATFNQPASNISMEYYYMPIEYTIEFYSNDSIETDLLNVTGSTESMNLTYDVSKKLNANGFAADGYTFKRWNTKANGTGTSYTNGQTVKNLTTTNGGKIILYAQWEKNYYAGVKTGDGWKDSIMYVNIGGNWKAVDDTYIKPNSIWKEGKP